MLHKSSLLYHEVVVVLSGVNGIVFEEITLGQQLSKPIEESSSHFYDVGSLHDLFSVWNLWGLVSETCHLEHLHGESRVVASRLARQALLIYGNTHFLVLDSLQLAGVLLDRYIRGVDSSQRARLRVEMYRWGSREAEVLQVLNTALILVDLGHVHVSFQDVVPHGIWERLLGRQNIWMFHHVGLGLMC